MNSSQIPVIIVGGYLGAGKTTLVNHMIRSSPPATTGVVVNEYGDVGIDGGLIVGETESVVEITNGCICCTVRSDLVAGVKSLLNAAEGRLERIIIETSGLADPAPVIQTFLINPELREAVRLESVITVVDAHHLPTQIADPLVQEQLLFADFIVFNKSELLQDEAARSTVARLARSVNKTAGAMFAEHAAIDGAQLFADQRFSLPNLLEHEPDLLASEEHDHEHDLSIATCSIRLEGPLDSSAFNRWVNELVQRQGSDLLRMKGVVWLAGEARQFVFHSVHMLLEMRPGKPWSASQQPHNLLVVIGRNLDPEVLEAGFRSCSAEIELQTNLHIGSPLAAARVS